MSQTQAKHSWPHCVQGGAHREEATGFASILVASQAGTFIPWSRLRVPRGRAPAAEPTPCFSFLLLG